jgi:oligopeptide transport system substrate-binding protein
MKIHPETAIFIFILAMSACQSAPSVPTAAPQPSSTPIPTNTVLPTFTAIPPTPTPIPGKVVIPITSMKNSIPWLAASFDPNNMPAVQWYGFNTTKPPFDNALVRQAFAAAVDKEAVAALATRLYARNVQPATTFIPPQMLGLDLYDQVGIPYDPARAKELLVEAGYSDVSSFPKTTFVISVSGSAAPGIYQQTAEAIIKMWKENLGIEVTLKNLGSGSNYMNYLNSNPNGFDIFRQGVFYNDAQNLDPSIIDLLSSNSEKSQGFNIGHFANDEFESLIEQARNETDPAKRQILYIDAERILCEQQAAIIPLYFYTLP